MEANNPCNLNYYQRNVIAAQNEAYDALSLKSIWSGKPDSPNSHRITELEEIATWFTNRGPGLAALKYCTPHTLWEEDLIALSKADCSLMKACCEKFRDDLFSLPLAIDYSGCAEELNHRYHPPVD